MPPSARLIGDRYLDDSCVEPCAATAIHRFSPIPRKFDPGSLGIRSWPMLKCSRLRWVHRELEVAERCRAKPCQASSRSECAEGVIGVGPMSVGMVGGFHGVCAPTGE